MSQARPRHSRQARFSGIGPEGQAKIAGSHAAIVGLGALGSVIAATLARAGVGTLTIIDRDVIEESNLQRQYLYTEAHVRENLPKAEAARRALLEIDSQLNIRAFTEDLAPGSIGQCLRAAEVVLDGTDNFQTRYLINDWCVERSVPWIYGAAVSGAGLSMAILPGDGPCLRCVFPEPTPPTETPTCETAGIIATASGMVALSQSNEALKLLAGRREAVVRGLLQIDPWNGIYKTLHVDRDPACPCCVHGAREWLRGGRADTAVTLCGRNSIQIAGDPARGGIDLDAMARRVEQVKKKNRFLLIFEAGGHEFTLFPDGRTIISNVSDPAAAKALHARFVGA